jgi:hypothetical protein
MKITMRRGPNIVFPPYFWLCIRRRKGVSIAIPPSLVFTKQRDKRGYEA